jgi:predicted RNase H-like HicB family nuclease
LDSAEADAYFSETSGAFMHNEFTALIERDGEWYVAYSPEVPGANGQGRTKEEAKADLAQAIALILEDRRADGLRGVPPDADRDIVVIK